MGKITPIIIALYFEGNTESIHHGFGITKILGCLYQVVYPGSNLRLIVLLQKRWTQKTQDANSLSTE